MKQILLTLPIPTHQEERTIRILLPDDYDSSLETYDVLYMHDGQNLFEDNQSYSGHSWRVYESLQKKGIKMIVVGIDNSDYRLFEYSPWSCTDTVKNMTKISVGGYGDIYSSWIVHSLKPLIDQTFRTKQDFEHTMIAGSSLGAFISVYIAASYPDVFSKIGVFSLASWFNEDAFLTYLDQKELKKDQSYYISVGKNESSNQNNPTFSQIYLENSRRFKKLLEKKGIQDIKYIETDEQHHERAWAKQFPDFLSFIYKKSTGHY